MMQRKPITFQQRKIEELDPNMRFVTSDLIVIGWGAPQFDQRTLRLCLCLKEEAEYLLVDDKGGKIIKVSNNDLDNEQAITQLIELGAISERVKDSNNKPLEMQTLRKQKVDVVNKTGKIESLPIDNSHEHKLIRDIFCIGEHGESPDTISFCEFFQLTSTIHELADKYATRCSLMSEARKGYNDLFPAVKKQTLSERLKTFISRKDEQLK